MNRRRLILAFIGLYVLPPIALIPFRDQLASVFPSVSVLQAGGMVVTSILLFVLVALLIVWDQQIEHGGVGR